jgi:hypothetical protein
MRLASTILATTAGLPSITKATADYRSCSLNGKTVSIHGINDMIRGLYTDMVTILKEQILLGCPIDSFLSLPKHDLFDQYRTAENLYSFARDERNHLIDHQHDLTFHLTSHPSLYQRFVSGHDENGQIIFQLDAIRSWLISVERFILLLWLFIHLTCGAPPRVKEYASYLWENTGTGFRSVFMHVNKQIFLYQSYNKTGGAHVARFLPKFVTPLIIVYSVLVRTTKL